MDINILYVDVVLLAPAARTRFQLKDIIRVLYSLLKLLPGFLTFQPSYIPDPHSPGTPEATGFSLHLLKSFWAELVKLVLEGLEDGALVPGHKRAACDGLSWD